MARGPELLLCNQMQFTCLNHMQMNPPHAVQAAAAGRGLSPSFGAVERDSAPTSEVRDVGLSACGGADQRCFDPRKLSFASRLFTVDRD